MTDHKKTMAKIIDLATGKILDNPSTSKNKFSNNTIAGDNFIMGNNNTHVTTNEYTSKPKIILDPDDSRYISDSQCALIISLKNEIVDLETICKKRPVTHGAVFSSLFRHLSTNRKRPEITKYRLIPVYLFEKAEKYLRQWIGRLSNSKTAIKGDPSWRNRRYAYIKVNEKKFDMQERLSAYLKKHHSVSSIKFLDDHALNLTYAAMNRWIKQ